MSRASVAIRWRHGRWVLPYLVAILTWVSTLWATAAHAAATAGAEHGDGEKTLVTVGLAGVMSLFSGVLTHFVTRREWSAKVADLERRLGIVESGPTRTEHAGLRDDQKTMEARFRADVGELHEKVNRVDRAVASVETETRVQSRSLALLMQHFGISDP